MRAFHNDPQIKRVLLAQLAAHEAADELVHGSYWQNGKGCAVGCTIHSDDHSLYTSRFGIPTALAHLEDCIFEGLTNSAARAWPRQFIEAIPVGADLSQVWPAFVIWLLTDPAEGVLRFAQREEARRIIQKVADLYSTGCADQTQWTAAAETAEMAVGAAGVEAEAEAAGAAIWAARAAVVVVGAVWTAEAAERAARAAGQAARVAVWAARAAVWAARAAVYAQQAKKLLALLSAAH